VPDRRHNLDTDLDTDLDIAARSPTAETPPQHRNITASSRQEEVT